MTGHLGWGHFDAVVQQAEFIMFMAGYMLLALDMVQQIKQAERKQERKRKEREEWG